MKRKMVVLAGMVVLCLGLVGTQASWANSLTFQDVMFNLNDTGGNTLTLEVNDVLSASGNWTGIDHLESFSLKGLGVTTLTLAVRMPRRSPAPLPPLPRQHGTRYHQHQLSLTRT